jgi:predicted nucleic acid-binding protein
MSRYVVDASVAVKWFVPEIHTQAALRLLHETHELVAPDLLFPEIGNTLWKKIRLEEIDRDEARQVLRALRALPLTIQPSAPLLEPALEIAIGLNRTVYDSLYVALALQHHCRMVTADRRLHQHLRGGPFAFHVQWVEDAL